MRRCDLLAICVLCTKLQCRMQPSVKLTGVATATAPHCNKAVNLKAEPPTRPDSQPTGTSGEPECLPSSSKTDELGRRAFPLGPGSLQSLSPYASWGSEGTRQERRKGRCICSQIRTYPSAPVPGVH